MKNSINKVILGSSTLLAVGAVAHHAQAASTGVPINAEVAAPISITQTQALNFGVLTDTGAGGTVTVGTGGTITGSTGASSGAGGTVAAGGFEITATTGRVINVTTPASVTIADGGNTMTVNSFSLLAPAAAGGASNTGNATTGAAIAANLTAANVTGFRLGGTIVVGAGQAAGTYSGTVTVTALYN